MTGKTILLLAALLSLSSCLSIDSTRREMGIPAGCVILSFDDGPNAHEDTTARLLDVLKKYNIRAMFALLGENAEHSPELVRRIHGEGHIIINHGYSDTWAVSLEGSSFRENLERGEAAIRGALGGAELPRLYRPQGGYYRDWQRRVWESEGYTMIAGSARAYDAVIGKRGAKKVIRRILRAVREQRGGMVLLHDARDSHFLMERELEKNPRGEFNRSWIPGAVEEIIIKLLEKGYRLTDSSALARYGLSRCDQPGRSTPCGEGAE
jgi:peptidoglycan/xylan/chitin deacetylase (PgdA/CDA1 family)